MSLVRPIRVKLFDFFCSESVSLFISFLYLDSYVLGDDKLEIVHVNQTSICLVSHLR